MSYQLVKRFVLVKGESVFATWPRPAFVPASNWWQPLYRVGEGATWRGQNILPAMWSRKSHADKMAAEHGGVVVEVFVEGFNSAHYTYEGSKPVQATANCTAESNFLAGFVATHGRYDPYLAELRAESEAATCEAQ